MEEHAIDFRKVWTYLNTENWRDPAYSCGKAFVAASFAKIAYLHIPDMELDQAGRTKFIPCYEHERMRRLNRRYDVLEFLRRGDFGESFVIETELSVSVITRAYNLLLIATRGTKTLHDVWVDVKALRKTVAINGTSYSFHRGFLQLAKDLLEEIEGPLVDYNLLHGDVPVYFVGHSLGGALSANMRLLAEQKQLTHGQAYIFGTPKYCDRQVLEDFDAPKSVVNPRDVVPRVPPAFARYPISQTVNAYSDGFPLPLRRLLQNHAMEHYLAETEKLL